MKQTYKIIFHALLFIQLFSIAAYSQNRHGDQSNFIDINNIKMWIGNNGRSSFNPLTDGPGFFWPSDSSTLVFADGLVWGGIVNGEIKANGSTARTGLQPGKILDNGKADNPVQDKYRVYKINRNWNTLPPGPERDKYQADYEEWPVELGAPWVDVNKDGIYTKGIDQPEFLGDEVLWSVSNDLDINRTIYMYGSLPIGLEIQTTVWCFNRHNLLGDVVFKKYKIINKSDYTILDMYFGYFSDPDVGDANDDYVGCDSTLSLAFAYNGYEHDEIYGTPPPAVGYQIIQVPKIKSNSSMISFIPYWRVSLGTTMPDTASELYNNLRGLLFNGDDFINPFTGESTKFALSGDPEKQTGWYEGRIYPDSTLPFQPGDKHFLLGTGPVTMTPGDTQEVVIAILAAKGESNVNSVTELKNMAVAVQYFYENYEPPPIKKQETYKPEFFYLGRNYPNPFNPSTKIEYEIPIESNVTIKVYNVLGGKVVTLLNEHKTPGKYSVDFDGSGITSGIYFYTITAREYTKTRKMLLLK